MFVRLIFETKKKERRGLMTMYVIFDWLPFLDFDRNSIEIKTCCSTKMIIIYLLRGKIDVHLLANVTHETRINHLIADSPRLTFD